MPGPMPEAAKNLIVRDAADVQSVVQDVDFVFCAVDMKKEEIRALEEAYARAECPVVSNNSAHRFTPDVPMVVPEINAGHIEVIPFQRRRLGTKRLCAPIRPFPVQAKRLPHGQRWWITASLILAAKRKKANRSP